MIKISDETIVGLGRVWSNAHHLAVLIDAETDSLGLPARPFDRADDLAGHTLALMGGVQALAANVTAVLYATDGTRHDYRVRLIGNGLRRAVEDLLSVRGWAVAKRHGGGVPGVLDAGYAADRAAQRMAHALRHLRGMVGDFRAPN